jgi:hypothetical protein
MTSESDYKNSYRAQIVKAYSKREVMTTTHEHTHYKEGLTHKSGGIRQRTLKPKGK